MAKTNIKKNAKGYGYTYTDLAQIHNELEAQGITYYQYIENIDGVDYIMTVINKNGLDQSPRRGCRIVEAKLSGKDNPVQAYGASLTYSRRYSLLLALGWATTDDDAACLTVEHGSRSTPVKSKGASSGASREEMLAEIRALAEQKGISEEALCKTARVDSLDDLEEQRMEYCILYLEEQ